MFTPLTKVITRDPGDEPSLLDGSGSPVVDVLDTVFVIEPLVGAVRVTVKFVAVALAKAISEVHRTVPLVRTPPPEALTNTALVGSVSITTTLLAVDGPRWPRRSSSPPHSRSE